MKAIHKIRNALRLVESSLLVSALGGIILLTVMQIIMRNLKAWVTYANANYESVSIAFQIPVFGWTETLNQHLVLLIAFLGAMVAGRKGEHIAFDIFQNYMPTKFKYHIALVGAFLSAGVCFYLAYLCSLITYANIIEGGSYIVFANVPQWVFEVFIPLGFLVMGYRLIKVSIHSLNNRHNLQNS